MYKINDIVVYKKDVCRIKDIKTNKTTGNTYYVMVPIDDESLVIDIPIENKTGFLRDLLSKDEVENLINEIPNIKPFDNLDDKNIELKYKQAITNGTHYDLIRVIKSSYIRNDHRIQNKKKISEKDDKYFKLAEKYLYNEFSAVLNMSFDDTKKYIIEKVQDKI